MGGKFSAVVVVVRNLSSGAWDKLEIQDLNTFSFFL